METFSKIFQLRSTVDFWATNSLNYLMKASAFFLTLDILQPIVLEFDLSDPSAYHNQGKYPFFLVSGCTAGNNYIYDPSRITQNNLSISEKFVLANELGSIGFLAS